MKPERAFDGYPLPTSNTTYTPNQFFDVVLPNSSRGVVRLVAFMIRKTLGWSDAEGNPQESEVLVSYSILEREAGIARGAIRPAIDEALTANFISCVRSGSCSTAGEFGSSALFELKWDETDRYITDPGEFRGFFAGNGNLTYIPNAFFDYTVRHETLAVVKVVGAIIRHTIGFQTRYGFRRQQVAMSFRALQRRLHIASPSALARALQVALTNNHIQRIEEGIFDTDAGMNSRPAVYGVHWKQAENIDPLLLSPVSQADEASRAVSNLTEELLSESDPSTSSHFSPTGSKSVAGIDATSSKTVAGDQFKNCSGSGSESVAAHRFKNRSGIKITPTNNTLEIQQQQAARPQGDLVADVNPLSESGIQTALQSHGFSFQTAASLVKGYPEDLIRQQIAWLPQRSATRNRLGLLRRAIEENWPEPVGWGGGPSGPDRPASAFAAHFYAGLADNPGNPTATPSANDVEAAAAVLQQILELDPDQEKASQWGREFGAFVRTSEQRAKYPIKSCVLAARGYGDEFVKAIRSRITKAKSDAVAAARKRHNETFRHAYNRYLKTLNETIRERFPERYEAFEQAEKTKRGKVCSPILQSESIRERILQSFDSEESKLQRMKEFFAEDDDCKPLDFWAWDKTLNPEAFSPKVHR